MSAAIPTEPAKVRKYQDVLRPLKPDEREALKASVKQYGLLERLIRDQHGDLIDGHHREDICAELGIALTAVHYQIVTVEDSAAWIRKHQAARRNLNQEEMRQLNADTIKANPGMSDRDVGRITGSDHVTVGKVRKTLEATGEIHQSPTVKGRDGREYSKAAVSAPNRRQRRQRSRI